MTIKPELIARILLTCVIITTVLLIIIMDFNCSHMTNPLWAPHARFHWSLQCFSTISLNLVALYLLWGRYANHNSRLAFVLAAVMPLSFWCSFFPSMLMPGTSTWPDGTTPFFVVAPQIFIGMIMIVICMIAIIIDARARINFSSQGETNVF